MGTELVAPWHSLDMIICMAFDPALELNLENGIVAAGRVIKLVPFSSSHGAADDAWSGGLLLSVGGRGLEM